MLSKAAIALLSSSILALILSISSSLTNFGPWRQEDIKHWIHYYLSLYEWAATYLGHLMNDMHRIQTSFKPLLSFFVRELILPHAAKTSEVPGYGGIVDTEIVILNQRIIEVRTLCLEGNKGKLTARNVAQ